MDVADGVLVAGYRIVRRLGSGGMGTVYLAQHPRLPRWDALKVLDDRHDGGSEFHARFLREAELAARLQHPNLVTVHDRGEHDGRLWIAMQYIDGGDLAGLIRRGPQVLTVERAVRILGDAAAGLDEIHRAGLLHLDVKPANILLASQADGSDRVLVTDFGVARAAGDTATSARDTAPSTSAPSGPATTLAYAAPEQFGDGPVDHRTDVYALGCTLYQMLTGSLPFPRTSAGSVMYAHLYEPPPRPSTVNPRVPREFDAVIATAMAKDPADRFDTCGELAAAARAALAASGPRRRVPLLVAAALVILVAVAATIVGLSSRSTSSQAKPKHLPVTGSVDGSQWGAYAYIAEAFPDLLPGFPYGAGYQDLSGCQPQDSKSNTVAYDTSLPVGTLFCLGNRDPVIDLEIDCNADRTPILPGVALANFPEGDEAWSRPSGSGHLFWGHTTFINSGSSLDGLTTGVLEVYFDHADRNFCRIQVVGTSASGADLRATWWPGAPI
ncbi:serine/threonine-protein kinase [Nocardia sp. CDC160]|uniref:serine/threonine-protein kinase n=1 Tax=Nocardia sp. CDC160 TaxID=3112166 RepID=UPI002DB729BC|nr:serine/threonine-protein kinase [Nocardia sp. CDC160]MEC3919417.1 serine/threonine-protein kinase [Nocardia sp. CDC160]